MDEAVTKQHAHPNTVFHCLYGYYRPGYTRATLATIYCKSDRTIGNWIRVYEATSIFERASSASHRGKFSLAQREWLRDFYFSRPLAYLDEAQDAFKTTHRLSISKSTVWRIIHEFGLTWKVLERRAMHIKERDVPRLVEELSAIDWCHVNLVFLDELSFDNRGMVRRRGYCLKGTTLAIRGDFQRKPRLSILAFLGVNSVLNFFCTDGTFDRAKFFQGCKDFAYSERSNVRQYPGLWILDGATIHCDPEIVYFFRSIGVLIFLPAYCPFFNPIEYLFDYVKRAIQRQYDERSGRDLSGFVARTLQQFENFNMARVFERCRWSVRGTFDPTGPMSRDEGTSGAAGATREEHFGFHEREDVETN